MDKFLKQITPLQNRHKIIEKSELFSTLKFEFIIKKNHKILGSDKLMSVALSKF